MMCQGVDFAIGEAVGLKLEGADEFWDHYHEAVGYVLGFSASDDPSSPISVQVWWPGFQDLTLHWPPAALVRRDPPAGVTFQQALSDANRRYALLLLETGRTSFMDPGSMNANGLVNP